jgi:hypothetical protein
VLRTGCRTGPLWLDVRGPMRDEGRHDLALRLRLIQEPVVIRVALRDASMVPETCRTHAHTRVKEKAHIPMSTPSRTKARISRLGSIANHLRKTSSSRYPSDTPSPPTHPSKTESALRSCVTKSDDLSSMYTSAGEVHLKGDDEGKSQAASCIRSFYEKGGNGCFAQTRLWRRKV